MNRGMRDWGEEARGWGKGREKGEVVWREREGGRGEGGRGGEEKEERGEEGEGEGEEKRGRKKVGGGKRGRRGQQGREEVGRGGGRREGGGVEEKGEKEYGPRFQLDKGRSFLGGQFAKKAPHLFVKPMAGGGCLGKGLGRRKGARKVTRSYPRKEIEGGAELDRRANSERQKYDTGYVPNGRSTQRMNATPRNSGVRNTGPQMETWSTCFSEKERVLLGGPAGSDWKIQYQDLGGSR